MSPDSIARPRPLPPSVTSAGWPAGRAGIAASAAAAGGGDCVVDKVVQFECRLDFDRIVCAPVERFFQRCAGFAAVEITPTAKDRSANPEVVKGVPHWG
ncbi:hypothetical protein HK105_201422 [Polyrhizophydium stewartii]|uniref:Uncharacterized protein n=1 Tax=Polyrhizophydium stewartii TaxID=2732419 RepID=A0ABR4NHY9_9FUNG